jgi:hypothetical protein
VSAGFPPLGGVLRSIADHVQWHGDLAGEAACRELADAYDPPDTDPDDETDAPEDKPTPKKTTATPPVK